MYSAENSLVYSDVDLVVSFSCKVFDVLLDQMSSQGDQSGKVLELNNGVEPISDQMVVVMGLRTLSEVKSKYRQRSELYSL